VNQALESSNFWITREGPHLQVFFVGYIWETRRTLVGDLQDFFFLGLQSAWCSMRDEGGCEPGGAYIKVLEHRIMSA
jgi:hypothetical protein